VPLLQRRESFIRRDAQIFVAYNVVALAREIKNSNWSPDVIVGVPRGGLPVAVMLGHLLDVKRTTCVDVGFRDLERTEIKLHSRPHFLPPYPKRALVVEDAVKTGTLIAYVATELSLEGIDVRTAALLRLSTSPLLSYTATTVDSIPAFPWEFGPLEHAPPGW
jgi:hypoxanthine phosphoribosyltransferase